jgi:SAM-dependent methyltransferase
LTVKDYSDYLKIVAGYVDKPALFAPGEPAGAPFWDDPHISKGMLEAHLDPLHEAASRPPETIDREVNHLSSPGLLKKGDKVLDLGCGPGLYAVRLAAKELKVTGIDISERSLNYAIAQARKYGFDIEFRLLSFFNLDYVHEFDAAFQAFGEIGTFSDGMRDILLDKIRTALKPGGLFIFDVTTPDLKHFTGSQNNWYLADSGFWRPGRHMTLELRFDYPENNVFVNQYIVIDEEKLTVYRIWNHNYTPETIKPVLEKAGFRIEHTWNSLDGKPYKKGGEWLAVAARKR